MFEVHSNEPCYKWIRFWRVNFMKNYHNYIQICFIMRCVTKGMTLYEFHMPLYRSYHAFPRKHCMFRLAGSDASCLWSTWFSTPLVNKCVYLFAWWVIFLLFCCMLTFSKLTFSKKSFRNTIRVLNGIGSRSGPTFCRLWFGSKL